MNETIVIGPARIADVEAIQALTRAAYAPWVAVIGREPLPMIADYERALREHRIDLVRRNGEILGLIEMIFKTDHLLIENVAVQPKCQGQGLGRRLLAHAEAVAAAEGYGTIRLFTNKLFRVNLKLYAGLGFGTDREEPFKGGTKVWMSKAINVAP